jgi:hypothetical protein
MREIRRELEIAAPAPRVWQVLTDFSSYPEWNPFMRSIEGDIAEGARIRVRIEPPGGRGVSIKPTVLVVEPERELRWIGRLLVPGVFDGVHSLRIDPIDEGRSRFTQAERFSGLTVGAFGSLLTRTAAGFERMNAALKVRAEERS